MIPRTEEGQPRIILVVDDAEDCVTTLDLALRSISGVVVQPARTGEEALRVLAHTMVAAVVTDVRLPAMTGLELIQRIREEPRFDSLPIVVVSADADPGVPRRAAELGASAFFAKPFSPGAVRRKLEELIHAR